MFSILILASSSSDINDLQNFVTIVLAEKEDDLTHKLLSDLHTVGTGFASLIYNLPATSSFTELFDKCKRVWKALHQNSNLQTVLVCILLIGRHVSSSVNSEVILVAMAKSMIVLTLIVMQ